MTKQATFEGNPCKTCGGVLRYQRCRSCVTCKAIKTAEYHARVKARRETDASFNESFLINKREQQRTLRAANPDRNRSESQRYRDRINADPSLRQKHLDKSRSRYHRGRKYGLTEDQVEALIAKADGRCEICQKPSELLLIDHCHATGVVRGMLCDFCNKGIGWLREDIAALQSAVSYLLRFPKQ